ncbi:MAG: ribose 5-phosphate isomerase [Bacilli bacterium]|nr:ribose 5-phosphate isomerase [Bacilli bacterium]
MEAKKLAGEKAVEYVEDGMLLGLGTGSTVYWSILKLGELVKKGLNIRCVPTSINTEKLAVELGIPLVKLSDIDQLDLAIDGADEVDPNLQLIKGGGGALLREKMVASIARRFIVVVDDSKFVSELGKFPLPVEVVQFGWDITSKQIAELGGSSVLRTFNREPFITDNGNYILDCHFPTLDDPVRITSELNLIPGVVENGLFVNMADIVVIGGTNGVVDTKFRG